MCVVCAGVRVHLNVDLPVCGVFVHVWFTDIVFVKPIVLMSMVIFHRSCLCMYACTFAYHMYLSVRVRTCVTVVVCLQYISL